MGATTKTDGLVDASSVGPEAKLAASGKDIHLMSLESSFNTLSGTSMACPHVSGAGGQLIVKDYTNKEARQHLKDIAEDIGLASNEQ